MLQTKQLPQCLGFDARFERYVSEFQCTHVFFAEDYQCKMIGPDKWQFSEGKVLEDVDLHKSISTLQNSKGFLTSNDINKLPHELVCEMLNDEKSDQKISKLGVMGNHSDDYTPDFILLNKTTFNVIEVKTTKNISDTSVPRTRALNAYKEPLKSRANSFGVNISFSIIIVTPQSVVSDLQFEQMEVNKLVSVMNFGHHLQEIAKSHGYVSDPLLMEIERKVQSIFRGIPFRDLNPTPLSISPDVVNRWNSDYNNGVHDCSFSSHFIKNLEKKGSAKVMTKEPLPNVGSNKQTPVLKWPFVLPSNLEEIKQRNYDTPLHTLWSQALAQSDAFDNNTSIFETFKDKRQRFRIRADLTDDDYDYLALYGIEGKRNDSEPKKERKKVKSQPLSENIDISGIKTFITNDTLMRRYEGDILDENQMLIDEAVDHDSLDVRSFYNTVQNSKLGVHLKVWTRICEELNISRRQCCEHSEFVVKFIPEYGIWLLIKPTNAQKHIFCSIMFTNFEKHSSVFRDPILFEDDIYISRFFSLNKGKINNHLSSSSLFPSIVGMFNQIYNKTILKLGRRSMISSIFTLISYLENKLSTSVDMLSSRHFYMETMTSNPDMFKTCSKWSKFIRSPLQCFYRQNFRHICRNTNLSNTGVSRLISWVDLEPFTDLEQALNTMYIGCVYNKFQGEVIHGFLKIFNKIIKEEAKIDKGETDISSSMGFKCSTNSHEFCPNTVKAMGDCIKSQIKYMGFDGLFSQVSKDISDTDWSYFSTTKASAIKPLMDEFNSIDQKKHYRRKCMAAVRELSTRFPGKKPYEVLPEILEECETQSLNIANMFRKPQLGGDREIFVLHINFRIVVYFLERIARTIAERLPGEMLTKPFSKAEISVGHFSQVKSIKSNYSSKRTVISSSDAETWAQRFVMPIFGVMYSRFLPEHMMNYMMRTLNLVSSKRLMLPTELMKLYSKHPEVKSTSPEMVMLMDNFLNGGSLMNSGEIYFKNWSNMMQGILHYTSTIYHWSYRALVKKTYNHIEKPLSNLFGEPVKIIYTFKVSSDDSSSHTTVLSEKCVQDKTLIDLTTRLANSEAECLVYAGSKTSKEKSAIAITSYDQDPHIEEFNSKWYEGGSTHSIIIKFFIKSVTLPSNGNPCDRLDLLSHLRRSLLSEGGSFRLCALVQMSQCDLHYRTMGYYTNETFRNDFDAVRSVGHPRFGSFTAEPSMVVGLFGQNYALYKRMKENSNCRNYESYLFKSKKIYSLDENSLNDLSFMIGNLNKFHSFLKDSNFDKQERIEFYDHHPEILYSDEDFVKRDLAFLSPSLPSHFKHPDFPDTAAMSVYYWNENVFSSTKSNDKVSLHSELLQVYNDYKLYEGSDKSLNWSEKFPYLNIFQELDEMMIQPRQRIPKGMTKKRVVNLCFNPDSPKTNLMSVLRFVWFNEKFDMDPSIIEEQWNELQTRFKWLKSTYQETYESLKPENHVQMRFLIESIKTKNLKVSIISSSKKSTSVYNSLTNLITQNQSPDCYYILNFNQEEDVPYSLETGVDFRALKNYLKSLTMIANGPNPADDIITYIRCYPIDEDLLERFMLTLPRSSSTYLYLAYCWLNPKRMNSMMIKQLKGGFLGGFTVRQAYRDGKYLGRGSYTMNFNEVDVRINIMDDKVYEIETNNVTNLRSRQKMVSDVISQMGLSIQDCTGSPLFNNRDGVNNKSGCVVSLSSHIEQLSTNNLTISQDGAYFRIKSYDSGRSITLLSSRPYLEFVSFKIPDEVLFSHIKSETSKAWIRGKTLDLKEINQLYKTMTKEEIEWCHEALRRRAPYIIDDWNDSPGTTKINIKFTEKQAFDVTQEDVFANVMSFNLSEVMKDFEVEDGNEDINPEDLFDVDFDADDLALLEYKSVQYDRTMSINTMFDTLINRCYEDEKNVKTMDDEEIAMTVQMFSMTSRFKLWWGAFPRRKPMIEE